MIEVLEKILQTLLFLAFLVISVPLHEFGHLVALKIFRCKTKLKIKWLEIIKVEDEIIPFYLHGCVGADDGESFDFPRVIAPIWKVVVVIICFSGGLISSAIMLLFVFLLPYSYKSLWSGPIYFAAIWPLFSAVFEVFSEYNRFYLSDIGHTTISMRSCR